MPYGRVREMVGGRVSIVLAHLLRRHTKENRLLGELPNHAELYEW